MRAIPLFLLVVLMAATPSTAAALTRAEQKAVDIRAANGASTASAAYAEIAFRGRVAEMLGTKGLRRTRVKVKFVPRSGKATTIVESGRAGAPNTRRRGTRGLTQVARSGRTVAVLVQGLPARARQVVVTTSGPGGGDRRRARLRSLRGEQRMERELERRDRALTRLWAAKTRADYRSFDARKRSKRKRLNALRQMLAGHIETLDAWIDIVDKALAGPARRECNDGVDGADPEDSVADFGSDKDPGCVMPLDNDEGDAPLTLTCPSPGGSQTVSAELTFAQPTQVERFILSLPPPAPDEPRLPIVDQPVTGSSGGPYPLETGVTQLCNYDFDFTYRYALFTDGLPAGTYGLRVSVSVANNGGFAGGEQLPFRLAAGTTR